ncbi:MAG: MarR family transcriptional regulator [Planctomycetota bacterium]
MTPAPGMTVGIAEDHGVLFVEGLKLRPTGERVLHALAELDGEPHPIHVNGLTAAELSEHTGLSRHVVRARLTDLRRLGLIESGRLRRHADLHVHVLTIEGVRRHRQMMR